MPTLEDYNGSYFEFSKDRLDHVQTELSDILMFLLQEKVDPNFFDLPKIDTFSSFESYPTLKIFNCLIENRQVTLMLDLFNNGLEIILQDRNTYKTEKSLTLKFTDEAFTQISYFDYINNERDGYSERIRLDPIENELTRSIVVNHGLNEYLQATSTTKIILSFDFNTRKTSFFSYREDILGDKTIVLNCSDPYFCNFFEDYADLIDIPLVNRVESWKEGLNEYYFLTCREQRIAIEQEITSIKDRYTWTFYFLANGVATKRRIEMSRENNIFTGVLDRNTKIKVYTRSFNMDLFYTLKPYKFEFISRNIVK